MPVDTTHALYDKYGPTWAKMRDVVAGHDAIQKGGEKYLPKLSDQEEDEYKIYRERATFFGATGRVVDALSGMVFRKKPDIEDAKSIKPMLDDMTLSGVPFDQFAEQLIEEVLTVTRTGVLVDHPQVQRQDGEVITLQRAEKMGYRAYATIYKTEDIINWRMTRRGGRSILGLVVLREVAETVKAGDLFALECSVQYRVLQLDESGLYTQSLYTAGANNQLVEEVIGYPLVNGKPLDEIPFTFFGAQGNEPDPEQPALYDLAVVNISHYRKTADYEHGLHFTGLPTAVISGVSATDTTYSIGSAKAWVFSDANAKAVYLEFTGQGLETMRKAIQDDELKMAALGARMLSPDKKAVETDEAMSNKRSGETGSLASMANAVSRGLTRVLGQMALWAGSSEKPKVRLNTDFNPGDISPQAITALLSAVVAGKLSAESFYEALVKGEVISGNRTFSEEQAQIDDDPDLAGQPVKAANDDGAAVSAAA